MKTKFLLLGVIFFMSSAVAQAKAVVDGVAAIVGGDIVLISELLARQEIREGIFDKQQRLTKGEVLEELIDEKLLKQEVEHLQIEASARDVDQALRSVLAQNRMTLDQLKQELAKKGIPYPDYRQDLEDRIRVMKFMRQSIYSQVEVTEADFQSYRRRYPHKSKQQSEEEIRMAILDVKAQEVLKSYLRGVRARTFVEVKRVS